MSQNTKVFTFYSDKIYHKSVDGLKGKEYILEGYVSTGDLDLVNDIVTKGCMDNMFGQFDSRVIKLDFEHEAFRGNSETEAQINKSRIPLGKTIDRFRDEKGLKVVWKMNPTWKKFDSKGDVTMTFKDIWQNIEEGYYDAFSIAYIPTSTAEKQIAGKDVRLLDKVKLLNVALTGNPVNPGATMTNVMAKSLDYMKDKGGIKVGKKGYDKDGAHSHSGDNEIGEHNHPEIEKQMSSEINYLNNRIINLSDRMYELNKNSSTGEAPMIKSKKGGQKMVEEVKPAEPVEPAKPVEPVKPAEPEGKQYKPKKPEDEEDDEKKKKKKEGEKKAEEEKLEVKSRLDAVEKENKELKEIVEKARPKGLGARDKSVNIQEKSSKGPLDMI